MANQFAIEPVLPADFPRKVDLWVCPITGMEVPKEPDANLQWRAALLEAAHDDPDFQSDLFTASSQSILFFINAFVFTLRVFDSDDDGSVKQAADKHIPFVTWDVQDRHLLRLESCLDNGESMLTDKSRDMGATWCHVAAYVHRLLFRPNESHLMISRKEDAVDMLDGLPRGYPFGTLADPGTLFGKIDYVLSRLPEWMIPQMSRKKMHLVNLDTGTRVDGESANASAGSSDRRTSIFLDEMAKMEHGESIRRSTRDVTACRLVCSTPNGPGTAYSKWRLSGQIPVFILPWWEHPEKGKNRYAEKDDLGRWKIRSPWYNAEEKQRTPKEMAIEIDMDHVGSGDTFFEGTIVEQHRIMFASDPLTTRSIQFKSSIPEAAIPDALLKKDTKQLRVARGNAWKIWTNLIDGRLDQTKTYTLAVDIGKGYGASNSVIAVMCNETKEKVACFADANTPPFELAKIVCAAAIWVGGRNGLPLLIWENNGEPGIDFGRQIVHIYRYPNLYYDRNTGTLSTKRGKRYGWNSTRDKKYEALGLLRRAYAHGGFINHDSDSLDETLMYVSYENGGVGPSVMLEESENTRAAHGDRVIADMLCVVAQSDAPRSRPADELTATTSPFTFGGRKRAWLDRKKAEKRGTHFNFKA